MSNEKDPETKKLSHLSRRVFVAAAAATAGVAAAPSAFAKKTKIDKPNITCGDPSEVSIDIQVCAPGGAGATGLPAGFSLQWMTKADYDANGGWISSDNPALCKASFSGNANLSRYNLAAGQCVAVKVGEFLFDSGASTNCGKALECDTEYVFRAFGHATSSLNRSDFTSNLLCSTLPCNEGGESCTFTQGYWKNHVVDADGIPIWPVNSLTLGTVNYDQTQLLSIFNTPAAGNGLISLAHQLIAAKLNVENGADPTDAQQAIADADALIGGLIIPPVGNGFLKPSVTSSLTEALTDYNEGATGPGHCN